MTPTPTERVFDKLIKREEGLAAPPDLFRLAVTDDLYILNELKSRLREQIARGKVNPDTYAQAKVLAEMLFDFFEPFLDDTIAVTDREKESYKIFKKYMDAELNALGKNTGDEVIVVYDVSRMLLRFAAKKRLTNIFQLTDERVVSNE